MDDRDNIIMHEMDDDHHSKSDNIDTQRLYLNANQGVVSAVFPRDKTVTQLLHNNPTHDESWPTSPSPRWIPSTSPHPSC